MRNQQASTSALTGFQSEERILPALPIRIVYQRHVQEHVMKPQGDDFAFHISREQDPNLTLELEGVDNPVKENAIRAKYAEQRSKYFDPYAMRREFEAVDSPEKALCFLSGAGIFWTYERVTWSQFQEWQRFFSWLRLGEHEACKSAEGKRAWATASGFQNTFFSTTDDEFTRLRFSPEAIKEIGPQRFRQIQNSDRAALLRLRMFALYLGQIDSDNPLSLSWYDPAEDKLPENWRPGKKEKSGPLAPWLRVEAHNILEAIAATIYADQAHGMKYGKCKHCGKLFQIQSEHGQEFCPATGQSMSSACKNAYTQKARRQRIKAAAKGGRA